MAGGTSGRNPVTRACIVALFYVGFPVNQGVISATESIAAGLFLLVHRRAVARIIKGIYRVFWEVESVGPPPPPMADV